MLVEAAVLLTALLLSAVTLLQQAPENYRSHRQGKRLMTRVAIRQTELVRMIESHERLVEAQALLEGTIEGTTKTVRGVHKGIASIPFGILESIPATRDTTRLVRGIHDLTSDGIYGAISLANKGAGKQLRRGLGEAKGVTNGKPNSTPNSNGGGDDGDV